MDYLSETISRYKCPTCERVGEADQWVNDPYIGLCCGKCGEEVKFDVERPAEWWSIGVYSVGRAYGGAEEGGWWYDTGSIIDEWTVRGFKVLEEARSYAIELERFYKDDKEVRVKGFTEKLPVRGFPDRRPVYC